MELYLQFGWGMMSLGLEICDRWQSTHVILSPRDLEPEQLLRHGSDLASKGASTYIDPQFFLPRADHHRLTSYQYWPSDFDTQEFDQAFTDRMILELVRLNTQIETAYFIVPGCRAISVDDNWLNMQDVFRTSALNQSGRPIMATVCLSAEAIKDENQISRLIQAEEASPAAAYYMVLERPNQAYITDDPVWLSNTLDIAASLKRMGSKVIIGYSNQQQLIMAAAGVDALASGTWMNVRSFPPSKFMDSQGDVKQKSNWFYLPQSLSEFKLQFLDIGVRLGLTEEIIPEPMTEFASSLVGSPQPSAVGWGERESFCHYLEALREQATSSSLSTFEHTLGRHREMLDRAESILERLHGSGVFGQHRDFGDAIGAHRSALIFLESTQGPVLSRQWNSLV